MRIFKHVADAFALLSGEVRKFRRELIETTRNLEQILRNGSYPTQEITGLRDRFSSDGQKYFDALNQGLIHTNRIPDTHNRLLSLVRSYHAKKFEKRVAYANRLLSESYAVFAIDTMEHAEMEYPGLYALIHTCLQHSLYCNRTNEKAKHGMNSLHDKLVRAYGADDESKSEDYQAAVKFFKEREYAEAIKHLDRAIEDNPDENGYHRIKGIAMFLETWDYDKAIMVLDRTTTDVNEHQKNIAALEFIFMRQKIRYYEHPFKLPECFARVPVKISPVPEAG